MGTTLFETNIFLTKINCQHIGIYYSTFISKFIGGLLQKSNQIKEFLIGTYCKDLAWFDRHLPVNLIRPQS